MAKTRSHIRSEPLKFGSLFSGIGGFDLGLERTGMTCEWQVEKDAKCLELLAAKFPNTKRFDDVCNVCNVGSVNLAPVDVICGGFPCQGLSVAGLRKGLVDSRSGLWYEFARVIGEMMPSWVLIENVPGLLSSNGGADMQVILDSMEGMGYVVDVDILDAQFFGVAQRRRRVFFACQHRDDLLKSRTTSSAQTIAQCLVEILGAILVESRFKLLSGQGKSEFPRWLSADGLAKRTTLFGLLSADHLKMLRDNLDDEQKRFLVVQNVWGFLPGGKGLGISSTEMGTKFESTSRGTESRFEEWNIGRSWRIALDDLCEMAKSFIILTCKRETTESTIYTCAKTYLNMLAFTALSIDSSPSYWNLVSSISIVGRAFINYARETSSSLFTEPHWVYAWRDFLRETERLRIAIRCSGIGRSAEQIFSLDESLPWDSPPSREAGEEIAKCLTRGSDSGSRFDGETETFVAATLNSGGNNGGFRSEPGEHLVAHTLRAECHDASEDGTGRGTPLVAAFVGDDCAGDDKRDSGKILQVLREKVGEKTFAEWGLGVLDSLQPEDLLQQEVFCSGEFRTEKKRTEVVSGTSKGTHRLPKWTVCEVRQAGCERRASHQWKLERSVLIELESYLSQLPQQGAQAKEILRDLWEASEGIGVLRQALSKIQKMGQPSCGKAQPALPGRGVRGVRRLTPLEAERIQGFPDNWTAGFSDSTRYRMLGNAVAVPVAEWIGRRIVTEFSSKAH